MLPPVCSARTYSLGKFLWIGVIGSIVACSKPAPRRTVEPPPTTPESTPDATPEPSGPTAAQEDAQAPTAADASVFVLPSTEDAGVDYTARWRAALVQLEHSLTDTTAPISSLVSSQPPAIREVVDEFVYCTAMQTLNACERFDQNGRMRCHFFSQIVRARSTAEHGWLQTPELLSVCTQFSSMTEAQCRQYAEAIETGNVGRCAGLPAIAADCVAHASGNGSRCHHGQNEDTSCSTDAHNYALLRQGVTALLQQGSGSLRGSAAGLQGGPTACTQLLHEGFGRVSVSPPANNTIPHLQQ